LTFGLVAGVVAARHRGVVNILVDALLVDVVDQLTIDGLRLSAVIVDLRLGVVIVDGLIRCKPRNLVQCSGRCGCGVFTLLLHLRDQIIRWECRGDVGTVNIGSCDTDHSLFI
jgi:hypothetical protein